MLFCRNRMYQQKSIAVVIPAHNEELLIARTIRAVPDYVDAIIVVNDASTDATAKIIDQCASENPKVKAIHHKNNGGVGAAISTGYLWAREHRIDVTAVMAGDGQMDPEDLPAIITPVITGEVDYTKGNRLVTGEAWKTIPRVRYLGNSALTFLTKIASGYWHVTDSQSGYTAISLKALETIPVEDIYPRYGMPNDLLVTLNIYGFQVMDVPIRPIYGIGEKSGIRIRTVIFTLSFLMVRLFLRRMTQRYIIRDFHPLVLFYAFGSLLLFTAIPLTIRMLYVWSITGSIPPINFLTVILFSILGFQSVLFAMLFDMEANRFRK